MNCENHANRAGTLTVDLPSINVRRYMCDECRAALNSAFASTRTVARSGRDPWGRIQEWSPDGRAYETSSAYGNPNEQYERKQFSGTNQGGKDE